MHPRVTALSNIPNTERRSQSAPSTPNVMGTEQAATIAQGAGTPDTSPPTTPRVHTKVKELTKEIARQREETNRLLNLLAERQAPTDREDRLIQLLVERQRTTERRVEGIQMPKYSGKIEESFQVFADKVSLYLKAKNIDGAAPDNQERVIAMIASNLKGQAAMWYAIYKDDIPTVAELYRLMQQEFVPEDLQERLRDKLYGLKQRECAGLEDYIYKYRGYMSQIKDMSKIDQVTLFCRGLVQRTREAVLYHRPTTYQEAIADALKYERTHPFQAKDSKNRGRHGSFQGVDS